MADVTIIGPSFSTYVRTVRLACVEKGISHVLEPVEFGSDAHSAIHPFRKFPAMRHGDFMLYETGAITRYIDRGFPGPALQPSDVRGLARMDQWISAISDYCYQVMIREVVIERVLVPMRGGTSDPAVIQAAWPKVSHQFDVLEAGLGDEPYLAGTSVTLADLFLLPIIFYLSRQPEAAELLARRKALSAWFDRMVGRPSFAATMPESPRAS